MTDPDEMSDSELAKLAKEVADRLERRGVVAGGAGIAAGGALGWLASGEARAGSQSAGTIGSQSNPVDLEAEDLNGADLLASSQGEVPQADGNGRLQMGTVQTEPNVPAYEEDPNSPFNASLTANSSQNFSLSQTYDIIKVHGELAATGTATTPFKLRPNASNGVFDYTVTFEDGSSSAGNGDIKIADVPGGDTYHFTFIMAGTFSGRWWADFSLPAHDGANPISRAFSNSSDPVSPISSIEIITGADPGDVAINVYGVEVANA